VFYYLADQIDSSRVIAEVPSGQTTATLCYDADFEPYGGEHAYTNNCAQNYKFTSKERDTESGLDNFGARYYASTTGRFMTPDWALRPIAVPYAKFGDPQTLNLYTYVENSPLNRIDADGHYSSGGSVSSSDACGNAGPGDVFCDADQGGGREGIRFNGGGMGDDAPTQVVETDPDSVLQARGDQFLAWAMATGNAGFGTTNSVPAHFEYSISTGEMWKVDASGNATFVGIGYSGKGNGLDNPFDQDVEGKRDKPDAGPIPSGSYTIGKMFDNTGKTGPGSMRLTPDAGNDMHGRSDFLIHGDNSKHNFSASEGCIILPPSARNAISSSGITRLEVNANIW